jgi:hypothetical protein
MLGSYSRNFDLNFRSRFLLETDCTGMSPQAFDKDEIEISFSNFEKGWLLV